MKKFNIGKLKKIFLIFLTLFCSNTYANILWTETDVNNGKPVDLNITQISFLDKRVKIYSDDIYFTNLTIGTDHIKNKFQLSTKDFTDLIHSHMPLSSKTLHIGFKREMDSNLNELILIRSLTVVE